MAGDFLKAGFEYEWEWVYSITNQHGVERYRVTPTGDKRDIEDALADIAQPGDFIERRKVITRIYVGDWEEHGRV
jgi:hypothetical protein